MADFLLFLLIGFIAQIIDGSMGMAYGVSCNTLLRSITGVSAVTASASVHFSEMFTTLASGISHFKLKNIDKRIFIRLIIPGIIGAVLGAYLLGSMYSDKWDPFIDAYLLIMGLVVLSKLFRKEHKERNPGKMLYPLGFIGGFCDAVGGGGWGPVVTSTLVATDHNVRKTIGSVNAAEFFVTVAESAAFFFVMQSDFLKNTSIIAGLILGGLIAAPVAAKLVSKIPLKLMLALVGGVIVGINGCSLISRLVQ